jgi:hypothetical protein
VAWPTNGEIDIIEGVNAGTTNSMTLHTSDGCDFTSSTAAQTGTWGSSTNCASSGDNNAGCGVQDSRTSAYGDGFNAGGGGVYAHEWTSDYIKIWFFPASSIPMDIQTNTPDPSQWGTPASFFQGGSNCDIGSHFKDHQIVSFPSASVLF